MARKALLQWQSGTTFVPSGLWRLLCAPWIWWLGGRIGYSVCVSNEWMAFSTGTIEFPPLSATCSFLSKNAVRKDFQDVSENAFICKPKAHWNAEKQERREAHACAAEVAMSPLVKGHYECVHSVILVLLDPFLSVQIRHSVRIWSTDVLHRATTPFVKLSCMRWCLDFAAATCQVGLAMLSHKN